MCGVVAVIGKQNASELVIEGLKKLEYRGYDSAGVASVSNGTLHNIKSEGKLINLINKFITNEYIPLETQTGDRRITTRVNRTGAWLMPDPVVTSCG